MTSALHDPHPGPHLGISDRFRHFASATGSVLGTPHAFIGAVTVIGLWALSGPFFGFSATWQLVINTTTTIVTFLMVFLLQNTQNRDSLAIQLKLDELLRGTAGPRTTLVNLEDLSDEQLKELREEFKQISGDTIESIEDAQQTLDRELGERQAAS